MARKSRTASDTRWLYRIESSLFANNEYANEERPIESLRRLARRVWKAEAQPGRKFPSIKTGDGCKVRGGWTSYCMGYTQIVLARRHRDILVLLHELTHALGPCVHGSKFVKLYFYLLRKYARFDESFLQGVAAGRGIVLN